MRNFSINLNNTAQVLLISLLTFGFIIISSSSVLAQGPGNTLSGQETRLPRVMVTGGGNQDSPPIMNINSSGGCITSPNLAGLQIVNGLSCPMINLNIVLTTSTGQILYNGSWAYLNPNNIAIINFPVNALTTGNNIVHATLTFLQDKDCSPIDRIYTLTQTYSINICQDRE